MKHARDNWIKIITKNIIIYATSLISNLFYKDKRLILFCGSSRSSYNESTRYLYEHLNDSNFKYNFVWVTDSKKVFKYLSDKKLKVVFHLSFQSLYFYLKAGMVITNGTIPLGWLGFVGKETVKITLNHGCGPRSTNGYDPNYYSSSSELIADLNKFDYYNFTSKFTSEAIGRNQYNLPEEKIINFGLPRCDKLLNSSFCKKINLDKQYLTNNYTDTSKDTKCILYAPTWRPSHHPKKNVLPLTLINDFNLDEFNFWLKEKNIKLFISCHSMSIYGLNINNLSNIEFLNQNDFFNMNDVLPEFDLLITDYSSIATDFMLMLKQVIYILPDYDFFYNEYGLLEDFIKDLPGPNIKNVDELKRNIINFLNMNNHEQNQILKYLNKYYDVKHVNSKKELSEFINSVLSN